MAGKRFFLRLVLLAEFSLVSASLRAQSGTFAYVANCGSYTPIGCFGVGTGNVSAYTIDGTTGALTPVVGSPFLAGANPYSVTVEPTGRFAYVANAASNDVSAYTIDGTTGALTLIPGSPFAAGVAPAFVTVSPSGLFAYVANIRSNNVSAYAIDGTTGALTPVAGSPFAAGSAPAGVTVDPTASFAYVANCGAPCGGAGPGSVSAYTIDGTTGALTPIAGSPFGAGSGPRSVTVDPAGQFAYVANCGAAVGGCGVGTGNVSAYTIDGTTGALTPIAGSPFATGSDPVWVTTTAGPAPSPPPAAVQPRPRP